MINNDLTSHLNRYFNNNLGKTPAANTNTNTANDMYKRIKERHDKIHGRTKPAEDAAQAEDAKQTAKKGGQTKTEDSKLSPEERRQKEVQAILDKINAAETAETAAAESKKTEATEKSDIITTTDPSEVQNNDNFLGFLNDLPLFNEFKTGLMDAFKRLDSATSGSISAQYELNYSTMQYVADEAGNFSYKETSVNIKLDLNYVKAAGGDGAKGKSLAELIGGAQDMSQLIDILGNNTGKSQGAAPTSPTDFMAGMQDYFSPEKTADRIVDFCTAFFPASDAFKAKGDTEEAREEFAEIMRKAVQKGFDQAMGTLGKVSDKVQEGIDKTHELTFKGIDDFVKNGMNRKKQEEGVYSSLEQLVFSAQFSYSEKTVSVRSGSGYTQTGASKDNAANTTQAALDTQA